MTRDVCDFCRNSNWVSVVPWGALLERLCVKYAPDHARSLSHGNAVACGLHDLRDWVRENFPYSVRCNQCPNGRHAIELERNAANGKGRGATVMAQFDPLVHRVHGAGKGDAKAVTPIESVGGRVCNFDSENFYEEILG